MRYAYNHIEDGGERIITFPDVPEATTVVFSDLDLSNECLDALTTAFEFYIESRKPIPKSTTLISDGFIDVPMIVALQIRFYNAWLKSDDHQANIALKMVMNEQPIELLFREGSTFNDVYINALKALSQEADFEDK